MRSSSRLASSGAGSRFFGKQALSVRERRSFYALGNSLCLRRPFHGFRSLLLRCPYPVAHPLRCYQRADYHRQRAFFPANQKPSTAHAHGCVTYPAPRWRRNHQLWSDTLYEQLFPRSQLARRPRASIRLNKRKRSTTLFAKLNEQHLQSDNPIASRACHALLQRVECVSHAKPRQASVDRLGKDAQRGVLSARSAEQPMPWA